MRRCRGSAARPGCGGLALLALPLLLLFPLQRVLDLRSRSAAAASTRVLRSGSVGPNCFSSSALEHPLLAWLRPATLPPPLPSILLDGLLLELRLLQARDLRRLELLGRCSGFRPQSAPPATSASWRSCRDRGRIDADRFRRILASLALGHLGQLGGRELHHLQGDDADIDERHGGGAGPQGVLVLLATVRMRSSASSAPNRLRTASGAAVAAPVAPAGSASGDTTSGAGAISAAAVVVAASVTAFELASSGWLVSSDIEIAKSAPDEAPRISRFLAGA